MRIGSICERKPDYDWSGRHAGSGPVPKLNTPYTVNWMRVDFGELYIGFEETDQRDCYKAEAFVELLPPEAMQEQIKELLEELVLI